MEKLPFSAETINKLAADSGIPKIGNASIREIVALVNRIEKASGIEFIRMEMGVPGLDPPALGTEAEINALRQGIASIYPAIEGVHELKKEHHSSAFLDIDVNPKDASLPAVPCRVICLFHVNRTDRNKEGSSSIPRFLVHKQQIQCWVMISIHLIYMITGRKLWKN
jgi:hypothetical protein